MCCAAGRPVVGCPRRASGVVDKCDTPPLTRGSARTLVRKGRRAAEGDGDHLNFIAQVPGNYGRRVGGRAIHHPRSAGCRAASGRRLPGRQLARPSAPSSVLAAGVIRALIRGPRTGAGSAALNGLFWKAPLRPAPDNAGAFSFPAPDSPARFQSLTPAGARPLCAARIPELGHAGTPDVRLSRRPQSGPRGGATTSPIDGLRYTAEVWPLSRSGQYEKLVVH